MVSRRVSAWTIIVLSTAFGSSSLYINAFSPAIATGLTTGWALNNYGVKPICKLEMMDSLSDAANITFKVALGEALGLYLTDHWGQKELSEWLQHSMKIPLYLEIVNDILTAKALYDKIRAVENSTTKSNDLLIEKLTDLWRISSNYVTDPLALRGLGYLTFGLLNAKFTTNLSEKYTNKFIPGQFSFTTVTTKERQGKAPITTTRTRTFDVSEGVKSLRRTAGVFAGTFVSSLIKNHADHSFLNRDEEHIRDEFYEKMYLIGIKSFFAFGHLTKLRKSSQSGTNYLWGLVYS